MKVEVAPNNMTEDEKKDQNGNAADEVGGHDLLLLGGTLILVPTDVVIAVSPVI